MPVGFDNKEIFIGDDEAHHMLDVKRHKVSDEVLLFNGDGDECVCKIIDIEHDQTSHKRIAKVAVRSVKRVNKEIGLNITVAFSVPKGKRSDLIIQKCSELGVKRLVPLNSERSVVKNNSNHKLEKWQRIAVETSKQCGRNIVTEIAKEMLFKSVHSLVQSHQLSLIFDNSDSHKGIKEILQNSTDVDSVLAIIGPEGGFSNVEIENALNWGCKGTRLTPQILRVETAAIAAVSMLVYEFSL